MKKILKSVLTLSLLVGVFASGAIFARTVSFPDVDPGDWFHQYVMEIADWDVVSGNDDGTFAPGRNINRAEFAKMLVQYDKRVDEKIAEAETAPNTKTTNTSTQDRLSSIMYLRTDKQLQPAKCPVGWEEFSFGGDTPDTLERICTTNDYCRVTYIDRSRESIAPNCPSGWSEADYNSIWSDTMRRTCYVCE